MKAYEFPIRLTPEGGLELPVPLKKLLHGNRSVRVIILVDEPADAEEQADWSQLTTSQFLQGYSSADSIYDRT